MNNLQQIVTRRAALVQQAEHQRAELGAVLSQFQRPAAIFDQGYALARKIKSHPGVAMGTVALLLLVLIKQGLISKVAAIVLNAAKLVAPVGRVFLSRNLLR